MTMPTTLTHGLVGVALGGTFFRKMPRRFWYLAVACATVQDLDVIGFRYGVNYGDLLGHRGLSHSLLFAFVISIIAVSSKRGNSFPRKGTVFLSWVRPAWTAVTDLTTVA